MADVQKGKRLHGSGRNPIQSWLDRDIRLTHRHTDEVYSRGSAAHNPDKMQDVDHILKGTGLPKTFPPDISSARLFYLLFLIYFLASENIKLNICVYETFIFYFFMDWPNVSRFGPAVRR